MVWVGRDLRIHPVPTPLPWTQVVQGCPIQPTHIQAFSQKVLFVVYCSAGKNPSPQNILLWEISQWKLCCPFCFQQKEVQELINVERQQSCVQAGFIQCSELGSRESKGNKPGSKLSPNGFSEMARTAQFGCLWVIFQIKALNYAEIKAENSSRLQFSSTLWITVHEYTLRNYLLFRDLLDPHTLHWAAE